MLAARQDKPRIAASSRNANMVRVLLLSGANPAYVNSKGETALTAAEKYHHYEVVNLLNFAYNYKIC